MSFENLNLHPLILKAINDAGYTSPTPIQEQAIPALLAGHDIMASAQTGTGKTAAFMLPALHRLAEPSSVPGRGPRVLVLTPTRELALQVSEAAAKYGKHLPRVRVVSILGGMPYPLAEQTAFATGRYSGGNTRPFDRPHPAWTHPVFASRNDGAGRSRSHA